jgi:hypothetical protein
MAFGLGGTQRFGCLANQLVNMAPGFGLKPAACNRMGAERSTNRSAHTNLNDGQTIVSEISIVAK